MWVSKTWVFFTYLLGNGNFLYKCCQQNRGEGIAIKSDHFQNDAKSYNKWSDVFLRQSDFTFVYEM